RAREGGGGAFAVGAGDVDHRRQAVLRIAEPFEQARDPVQRQVEALRVERHEALDFTVGRLCRGHGNPALLAGRHRALPELCRSEASDGASRQAFAASPAPSTAGTFWCVSAASETGVFRRILRSRAIVFFISRRDTTMSTM